MPTWPTLPPFSAANFLDHFDSLDTSKWTAVTSGTGSVTTTDSYLQCNSPANSAAFVYYNTKLDKTKNQLWLICFDNHTLGAGVEGGQCFNILNGASAPAADTAANIVAKTVIRRVFDGGALSMQDEHWNAGNTRNFWNASTASWGTGFADSIANARADDYYIVGLEIDATNQRWRLLGLGRSFATAGTYTFDQGFRLFSLTDWVTWANTRSNSDLWLVLGNPYTNMSGAREARIEWVRYAEGTPIDAWVAAKTSFTGLDHRIRHLWSYDGLTFIPQDRTTWALNLGTAGGPDDEGLQGPCCVNDGGNTDYLFYSGFDGGNWRICAASATKARPQNGPWTKLGVMIPLGSAGANDDRRTDRPFVICDQLESDPNKRWKMLYNGEKTADNKFRIMYATAPQASGTWTKQGTVIDVGGVGSRDESQCVFPTIVYYNGIWEVWYEGKETGDPEYLLRATGADLASLTKDGVDYTAAVASATQSLTANLNTAPGRTVTVADTSGFVQDASVLFSESTTMDNYGYSKIRKVVSSTVLELYHGVTGFGTAYPAKIKQFSAARNRSPRAIVRVGSEWWFYLTVWEPFAQTADVGSYNPGCEEMHLWKHSNTSPSAAIGVLQYHPSPVNLRGFNDDQRSAENMTLLYSPVVPDQAAARVPILPTFGGASW
jgi:hypothetical protein